MCFFLIANIPLWPRHSGVPSHSCFLANMYPHIRIPPSPLTSFRLISGAGIGAECNQCERTNTNTVCPDPREMKHGHRPQRKRLLRLVLTSLRNPPPFSPSIRVPFLCALSLPFCRQALDGQLDFSATERHPRHGCRRGQGAAGDHVGVPRNDPARNPVSVHWLVCAVGC